MKNYNILINLSLLLIPFLSSCQISPDISKYNFVAKIKDQNIIRGKVNFPSSFKVKATVNEVGQNATVSILYPSDHPTTPNYTIATGLSNSNGNFQINLDSNFNPANNSIYVLEASRRIGGIGKSFLTLRTYLKFQSNSWKSITFPNIVINSQTTSLSIVSGYKYKGLSSSEVINKIEVLDNNINIFDINSNVKSTLISDITALVDYALINNYDPTQYIKFNDDKFYINNPISLVKKYALVKGEITTVAGLGGSPGYSFSGDYGPAELARFGYPSGLAIDSSGNLLISDNTNHRIRKVDKNTGIITTIAGSDTGSYTGAYNGDNIPATQSKLNSPRVIVTDNSNNLYIADGFNHRIRKVDTNGIITTIAGNGTAGFSGDNALAINAQISEPRGICLDNEGNIYIADTGNNRLRKVDKNTGIITTIAGNGTAGFSGDNTLAINASLSAPRNVTFDDLGNIYIADTNNNAIRKIDKNTSIITTVVGTGIQGYSGDGGLSNQAKLYQPLSVTFDKNKDMIVSDTNNNVIRKIDKNTGIITTIAGNGTSGFSGDNGPASLSLLNAPRITICDNDGNLYIADSNSHKVRKILY